MKKIYSHIAAFLKDEEGASAIEYAMIAMLIGIAISAGAGALGTGLNETFTKIVTALSAALP
jgi:pilus assembly protein Flp/PilA